MPDEEGQERGGNVDSTGTLRFVPAFGDDGSLSRPGSSIPAAEAAHLSVEQTVLLSASQSAQLSAAAGGDPSSGEQPPPLGNRFHRLRPWREGGLGKVWIALDRELHREVALKEIKSQHAGNRTSQERFLIEGEITGSLEHPSIVPVYGMGRYSDGRPYYAMRFVHGQSLEEAIERYHHPEKLTRDQQLSPTQSNPNQEPAPPASFQLASELGSRVESVGAAPIDKTIRQAAADIASNRAVAFRELLGHFIAVCNAIAYAHSRGVLHRDLKPANILLAKYGETLVVDWGLAKVAGLKDQFDVASGESALELQSGNSTAQTRLGAVVGTPAFMSPEQAQGRQDLMTSASDIYSLGATLYCLLTGRSPFEGHQLETVLDQVRHGHFQRPRQVNSAVPRALESICLKAMAVRREDRYSTATALADDLQHWLADEPVSAHPENSLQRAARWVRRHKAAAISSAVGIVLLALVSTVGVVLVEHQRQIADRLANENGRLAIQEHAAKEQAELAFREARNAVDDLFTKVSEDSLLNAPGMQRVRRDLLQKTLDYYEQFLKQRTDDPTVEEELATTQFRAGRIIDELRSPEEALPHLRTARDMQSGLLGKSPQNPARMKALGETENALGRSLHRSHQYEAALAEYQKGRGLRQQLADLTPDDQDSQRALANSIMNIGLVEMDRGNLDAAAEQFRAAQQLREALLKKKNSFNLQRDLAMGVYNQGNLEVKRKDSNEAATYFGRAVEQFEKLRAEEPSDLTVRYYLALSYREAAAAYQDLKLEDESQRLYGMAHDWFAWLVDRNPDVVEYQAALAGIDLNVGDFKKGPEAIARFESSTSILGDLVKHYPENARFRRDLAVALRKLGIEQFKSGNLEVGRQNIQASVSQLEKLTDEFPADTDLQEQLRKSREAWGNAVLPSQPQNA
jgi:eukaryotic-like serine/threonine-protein kinase